MTCFNLNTTTMKRLHSERRQFLAQGVALGGALLPGLGATQPAWPSRPVFIIVPNAPGGPADLIARAVSSAMAKELGTGVVVENKPGAAGKIGIQALLKAPRDGHTVAITSVTALSALPVFDPNVGYRSPEDFSPLTLAVRTPAVWCVHPSLGIDSLRKLAAYAKAQPNKLNYASFGTNSSSHLAQEDFFRRLDVRLTHIPFKGESEGMNALLAGQVQVMLLSGAAKPQIEAGRLVALAVTTKTRWDVLPNVKTARESGLPELEDYSYEPWLGFSAAAGTPPEVVDRLQKAIRNAINSEEATATFKRLGFRPVASTPKEMQEAVVEDMTLYRVLLRSGRVRVE